MPEKLWEALSRAEHQRAIRLYRAQNVIWIWLGLAAAFSCIAWFADPDGAAQQSAIGHQLSSSLDDIWNIVWAVGGMMIAHGIWFYRPRTEFIGHLAVTSAITTYTIAILTEAGPVPSFWVTGGIAVASALRAYFLWMVTPKKKDDVAA